jgi:glycosyltransferase involved in cell wall biosynthesis
LLVTSGRRHVLVIVENLPVPFDRRVWLESKALQTNGYNVTVICPKSRGFNKSYERLENVDIYRHPMPIEGSRGLSGYMGEYAFALFFEFLYSCYVYLRNPFQAIHACNPPDDIFLIGRFFRLFGVRYIYDQHDLNPELYLAKYQKKAWPYHVLKWLERCSFRTADLVISTNESYRDIALSRGGVSPDRVHIVRSAPDIARFHAVEPKVDLKRGRKFLAVYLGVMGFQEGVDLLLEIIADIVFGSGRNDISFTLIGRGPEFENLHQLASELKIDDYVKFTGRVPDSELLQYLSTADLCVNPDRSNELNDKSTMNKIMEYMAVGKPIVQFESVEGRFSAKDASLYARPGDREHFAQLVLQLIDNPDLRKQMGDFGLRRMETELAWSFSRSALLAAYENLFSRIASPSG